MASLRTGLTFDDVLLVPQRSAVRSRRTVDCSTSLSRNVSLGLPVVAANMDTVCETDMAIALAKLGGAGILHRFCPVEHQVAMVRQVKAAGKDLIVGAAIGTDHDGQERAGALSAAGVDALVLDIAHGHADHALEAVAAIKAEHPHLDLIAGNVATRAGAEDLAAAGADAIKVGVGPGGVCTTRLVAGVGVPQLTAIMDVAGVTDNDGHRLPVIADGGIRTSGDVAKAIAAGADTMMMGSLLAGTDESPGTLESTPTGMVKRIRGMASFEAVEARAERSGEVVDAEYFEQRAPEGVEGTVPYRGPVAELVNTMMAGLKSGMSYSNATTITEFWERSEFIGVTPAGQRENLPHATLGW